MCGICGIYNFTGRPASLDVGLLDRMNQIIAHRGPDDSGFFVDGSVGLGMRRLSIIDVEGGHQPVFNEDRSCALVFNGEIYGYVELRNELERLGHHFTTHSDTETIIHAYEQYSVRCVDYLNGMFAFAIWDSRKQELFIARDRVGEKPLFYTRIGDQLLFASEIKSILLHPNCRREVCEEALDHYLTALYIPYPLTIFRDIYKLPPGSWMRASEQGLQIERYWHPERILPRTITLDEAVGEFKELFADVIRIQMRSDVPVGVSISGGMDSTTVASYAAQVADSTPLKTFALGFTGADWDERSDAHSVARLIGSEHYDINLTPEDVCQLLPRLVWLLDEPMGDGAIVPIYQVSQLARQHVKVLLNGSGGDELFAGYPRHQVGLLAPRNRLLKRVPSPLKAIAVGAGSLYSRGFGNRVYVALRDVDRHYYEDNSWFTDRERMALTGRNGSPYARVVSYHYRRAHWNDPVTRLTFVDMNTYLSDDLLPMIDRMTMGVSLEGRSPLLDYRLVEWALALPSHLKIHNGTTKYVLRRAMQDQLPPHILRNAKRGFGPPFTAWLQAGLLETTQQMLLSPVAQERGLYEPNEVRALLAADISDHRTSQRIWMLLVLETWFRLFIDQPLQSPPTCAVSDLL